MINNNEERQDPLPLTYKARKGKIILNENRVTSCYLDLTYSKFECKRNMRKLFVFIENFCYLNCGVGYWGVYI